MFFLYSCICITPRYEVRFACTVHVHKSTIPSDPERLCARIREGCVSIKYQDREEFRRSPSIMPVIREMKERKVRMNVGGC